MSGPSRQGLGRWAIALALLPVVAVAVILAIARTQAMGTDDALYMSIGTNMLAGRGAVDSFGYFPLVHAPMWPLILAAPQSAVGIDPSTTAHVLVVLSAVAIVALVARLTWEALPWAAPVAASAMLAFGYFLSLGTGLGLDLPVAALTLLYIVVGLTAARRGSLGWGVAAGLIFAVAFTVKETVLPFAPVPVFAGLVTGLEARRVFRSAGAALLALLAGTSWWWILYAQHFGTVYRIGTPAWTLVPLFVAGVALGVGWLMANRWARLPLAQRFSRTSLVAAGWIGAVLWSAALTLYFARATAGTSAGFLRPAQILHDLATWAPQLRIVLPVTLVGGVLAIADRVANRRLQDPLPTGPVEAIGDDTTPDRPDPDPGRPVKAAVDTLIVAILCGSTMIPLVVSVGEGPRHLIAVIGLGAALGSVGWVGLAIRAARSGRVAIVAVVAVAVAAMLFLQRSPVSILRDLKAHPVIVLAVIGVVLIAILALVAARRGAADGVRSRRLGVWLPVAVGAVIVAAAITSAGATTVAAQSADVPAMTQAQATVAAWIRANVAPGGVIAFGRIGAFETALPVQLAYHTVLVRDEPDIRVSPGAPLGIAASDGQGLGDWFAMRESKFDTVSFYGYSAATTADALRSTGATVWIQMEVGGTSNISPVIDALAASSGVTPVAHWSWARGAGQLECTIYRVDPSALSFTDHLYITKAGLTRLVTGLERSPATAAPAASALLDRVVLVPAGVQAPDLIDRLRRIAGR